MFHPFIEPPNHLLNTLPLDDFVGSTMVLSMKDSTRIQMAGSASITNRLLEQTVDARIIPALVLIRRIGISSERDHRPQEIE